MTPSLSLAQTKKHFVLFPYRLQRHKRVTAGRRHAPTSRRCRDRAVSQDAVGIEAVIDIVTEEVVNNHEYAIDWHETSGAQTNPHWDNTIPANWSVSSRDETSIGNQDITTFQDLP